MIELYLKLYNLLTEFKNYGPVQFPLLSNVLQSSRKTYFFHIKVQELDYTFPQSTCDLLMVFFI